MYKVCKFDGNDQLTIIAYLKDNSNHILKDAN